MEFSPEDYDEDWTEAEDRAWCIDTRANLLRYLVAEGVEHGEVSEWPAWHIGPHAGIWAIQSLVAPGKVGWWGIGGDDLPCDYCSAKASDDPRLAVQRIAEGWRAAVDATMPGDETISGLNLPADFAPLLAVRADALLEWVDDPEVWTD